MKLNILKETLFFSFLIICGYVFLAGTSNTTSKAENTGLEIVTFAIDKGQIGESEIISDTDSFEVKVYVEVGTDLSSATPNIKISKGASIEPVSGEAIDFASNDNKCTYTVTSESGEERKWQVEIIEKVTFVLLPDTQSYAQNVEYRPYFISQIDWILENKDEIHMVLQQGDLTNRNTVSQWEFIESEFSRLNKEVPYVLSVGNHDMGPDGKANNRNTSYFNQFFPYSTMSDLPTFGGIYPDPDGSDKMDNVYYLLDTGKHKWLIITLEFGPRKEVLTWAKRITEKYSDRTVILNTHAYMYSNDTRIGPVDDWNPHDYGIDELGPNEVNDGEEIWDSLVKESPNIRFIFSGHILHDGVGTLVSRNNAGEQVYQFLANFQSGVQGSKNGGNGYLRMMTIDFTNEKLIVESFSSYPGVGAHPDGQHNFEISSLSLD